jgi:hypothetical protein
MGGKVPLRELRLGLPRRRGKTSEVKVQRDGRRVARKLEVVDGEVRIRLARLQKLSPGETLRVTAKV